MIELTLVLQHTICIFFLCQYSLPLKGVFSRRAEVKSPFLGSLATKISYYPEIYAKQCGMPVGCGISYSNCGWHVVWPTGLAHKNIIDPNLDDYYSRRVC